MIAKPKLQSDQIKCVTGLINIQIITKVYHKINFCTKSAVIPARSPKISLRPANLKSL